MATNAKESRRRKILERGSDRLAFITGRAPTPLPPPQAQLHHAPVISDEPRLSDQTRVSPNGGDEGEGDTSSSMPLKEDPVADTSHASAYHQERSVKSPLPKCGTSSEALSNPASVVNGSDQLDAQRYQRKSFNPSLITSAITATQLARLLCSVAVALVVALSYLGFPLLGSRIIKSIVTFKPLYLVLLTNVTVVLVRLIFDKQEGSQSASRRENNIPSTDESDWAEQASNALEIGLMMQKVTDAIFMDCSIYSIILICGLSFSWQVS